MRRLPIALLMVAVTPLGFPPSGSAQTVGEVFQKVNPSVVVIRAKGPRYLCGKWTGPVQ
jgi:hypothetical protein